MCAHALTGLGLLGLLFVHPEISGASVGAPKQLPGAPVATASHPATTRLAVAPEAPLPLIAPAPPNLRGAVPTGKGMWIWQPERAEGANAQAIVAKAQRYGINHLYVRMGSSKSGFVAQGFLNALLPPAHAAGIKVYGWDFPYLDDVGADVVRANAAVHYLTPDQHRIDGFAADIEFKSMGVNLSPETTSLYGRALRDAVGPTFPLIAVVPRPTPSVTFYPYEQVVASFDAIAPMVYWLNNDPVASVRMTFNRLARFGKPIIPIGQAYDGFAEGGPPGVPNRDAIHRFMGAAAESGGTSVSFWSWQHANDEVWQAVSDAAVFQLPVAGIPFRPDQIHAYQVLLSSLGFPVPWTAQWDPATDAALKAFQTACRMPATGVLDALTREMLLRPVPPPLR